jgi:hypothetical protein
MAQDNVIREIVKTVEVDLHSREYRLEIVARDKAYSVNAYRKEFVRVDRASASDALIEGSAEGWVEIPEFPWVHEQTVDEALGSGLRRLGEVVR